MFGNNTKKSNLANGELAAPLKKPSKKQTLVIGFFVLLVVVAGVSVFLRVNGNKKMASNQCGGTSESVIYNEAQVSLGKLMQPDLSNTVEKIKKQKDFEKDANCLYPVVVHYIREGDANNAQKYYDKMQLAYQDEIGFADVYGLAGRKTMQEMAMPVVELKLKEGEKDGQGLPAL